MRNTPKRVLVYITNDVYSWLDAKTKEGYKKSTLINHVLQEHIRNA